MSKVVERLIRLPRDFRGGSVSPVALVTRSGYLADSESLTVATVLEMLRSDPSLVDEWEQWSMDKRSDGWCLYAEGGEFLVVCIATIGGRYIDDAYTHEGGKTLVQERLVFSDRQAACAEFIVREIRSIATHC